MTAREEILGRVRTALGPEAIDSEGSYASVPRGYSASSGLSREQVLELFLDRLLDYDTEVIEVEGEVELPEAIAQALTGAGERHAVVAGEFPVGWLPEGFRIDADFPADGALSVVDVEGAEAVITTCAAGVASTGTIVLVHEGAQGRRLLTLLPDHHVCVVRRDQVVGTVPEAVGVIGSTKPVTTISGPSATSDIEMTRIRGVHGPRRLTVVLWG